MEGETKINTPRQKRRVSAGADSLADEGNQRTQKKSKPNVKTEPVDPVVEEVRESEDASERQSELVQKMFDDFAG